MKAPSWFMANLKGLKGGVACKTLNHLHHADAQRPVDYLRLLQQLCLQELIPEEFKNELFTTLCEEARTQYPKEIVENKGPDSRRRKSGEFQRKERPRERLFQGRTEETKTVDWGKVGSRKGRIAA